MSVKKAVKKVVEKVKETVKPKVVKAVVSTEKVVCTNCSSKGEQCSVCTPIFTDTFK